MLWFNMCCFCQVIPIYPPHLVVSYVVFSNVSGPASASQSFHILQPAAETHRMDFLPLQLILWAMLFSLVLAIIMIVHLTTALYLRGVLPQSLSVVLYVYSIISLYINIRSDTAHKLLQSYTSYVLIGFLKLACRKRNFHQPQLLINCSS